MALLLTGCSQEDLERTHPVPAPLEEPSEYPSIRRADKILDPSGDISADEWAGFYPQVVSDPGELWTFRGKLVPARGASLEREKIRIQLSRVRAGHFSPNFISLRTESNGSFEFRGLPPAEGVRVSMDSRTHQLSDEFVEYAVSRVSSGEVEIPYYRWSTLTFKLRRADEFPLGRWMAGLQRPHQTAMNWLAPDSVTNDARNSYQRTRSPIETVRFDRLTSGTTILQILLPNFGGLRIPVRAEGGENVDLGTLVVPRGASLDVVIAADDGVIIPEGLQVQLLRREATSSYTPRGRRREFFEPDIMSTLRSASLNPDFPSTRFEGNFRGTYILKAVLPGPSGFVTQPQEVVIGVADTSATIRMRAFGTLDGTISKSDGSPAVGAIVSLRDENRDGNRDGTFRLILPILDGARFGAAIPEGSYELTARSPSNVGYPRVERYIKIKSGETTRANIAFNPTTIFRGRILQKVHPPRETSLSLHFRSRLQDYVPIQMEQDLTFENLAVPQGDFDLFDNHTDFIGRYDLRGVESGAAQNIEVRRAKVEITPIDSKGRRVPHAYAYLIPLDAAQPYRPPLRYRFANRDDQGRLEFDRVLTGDYELIVDAPGFGRTRRPLTILAEGSFKERVTLDPPGGAITLRVRREHDGTPVFHAVVQEFRLDGESIPYGGMTTNTLGEIELRDLPEGTLEFDIWPAHEIPLLAPYRVRVPDLRSDENRIVEVALGSASPVAAVVLDSRDEPIAGAHIRVRGLSSDPIIEGVARWMENYNDLSTESGMIRTMYLPQGRSMLFVVKAPGRREIEAVVTPTGALRTIVEFKYPRD